MVGGQGRSVLQRTTRAAARGRTGGPVSIRRRGRACGEARFAALDRRAVGADDVSGTEGDFRAGSLGGRSARGAARATARFPNCWRQPAAAGWSSPTIRRRWPMRWWSCCWIRPPRGRWASVAAWASSKFFPPARWRPGRWTFIADSCAARRGRRPRGRRPSSRRDSGLLIDSPKESGGIDTVRDLDELFTALGRSSFRRKFRLVGRDGDYLARHGLEQVLAHGRQFITTRLVPARPAADGRQTPLAGHPVFVAQHATATCCRNCLRRWHGIARFRPLTSEEIAYVLGVLRRWLELAGERCSAPRVDKQRQHRLFSADE